ncbi:SpoIIE family protein phosphatase [Streptomyces jeddahensis]|uniref:Phosphoserine phosphatase RsbU n=1 Tax=Streptomyces jeddahensis TaxID=1716141 RepID=A0A177HR42_9ACTN|nr:SpoIIE family protein phosphatase [Streptomyces jeddahensis]OAH12638.1 phosphoserine phosphatase RsbU [Streptomyces jeddahensis]
MTGRHDEEQRTAGPETVSVAVDAQGNVTAWSPGAQRLLGHAPADVVGRPLAGLIDAEDREAAMAGFPAAGQATEWTQSVTLVHRDGRRLDMCLRGVPLLDGEGRPQWFLTLRRPAQPTTSDDVAELLEWVFNQSPIAMTLHDGERRMIRANSEMTRILGRSEEQMRGLRAPDIASASRTAERLDRALDLALRTGEPSMEEILDRVPPETQVRAWTTVISPLKDPAGQVRAASTALFDVTEQYRARRRLTVLNEASTRIGGSLDVHRTALETVQLVVPMLADFATVDLLEQELEPPGAIPPPDGTVTLIRMAQESVLEGYPESVVASGEAHEYPAISPLARCLVTGRATRHYTGDPEIQAWLHASRKREASVRRYGIHSLMSVPLRARGTTLGLLLFMRHEQPLPFDDDDLFLAEEVAARAAVCIDNARRYTRERSTAVTLQRSLLPGHLPPQAAVEVASRYLPAGPQIGVGGDWFDVIPLSGTRVALVVGDVVGHGIHASATMGLLRTAVRTLADVDLPPDELLTHLDDVVSRLNAEQEPNGARGDIGASCLYAVYDPVSRRCTLARAGHPEPALVTPDGTARYIRMPAGPPLGLGGMPFESTEVELPEGSLLALYTDGLIESRDADLGVRLNELLRALAEPAPSLEATCESALKALLSDRPADDVALLTVRTRALTADQVATWTLPSEPAVVSEARSLVAGQLATWGVGEAAAYVTELVVSELVTNAIRYGASPIQLRLIHDRTLICEVSDANSAAPHLRRARVFDEGGRGLLLVAQLTQAWGTRQTSAGKTIWAEQSLVDY